MGQSRLGGASCTCSHLRNAALATVGPKKAACRKGPETGVKLTVPARSTWLTSSPAIFSLQSTFQKWLLVVGLRTDLSIMLRDRSKRSTLATSALEIVEKSVPFGKKSRIRPLVFSFKPRSHA